MDRWKGVEFITDRQWQKINRRAIAGLCLMLAIGLAGWGIYEVGTSLWASIPEYARELLIETLKPVCGGVVVLAAILILLAIAATLLDEGEPEKEE